MLSNSQKNGGGGGGHKDQPFVDFRPDSDGLNTLMRGVWQPHFSSTYTITAPNPDVVNDLFRVATRWAEVGFNKISGGSGQLPAGAALGDSFRADHLNVSVKAVSFRPTGPDSHDGSASAGAFHLLLEHRDSHFRERTWRTTIGGKAIPAHGDGMSSALLSVSSSFKDNGPSPVPFSSVPFISFLGDNLPKQAAIYSGRTKLRNGPAVVDSTEELFDVFMALTDETRRHPIVLVSGWTAPNGSVSYLVDPKRLSKTLRGIAQVYVESPRSLALGASRGLTDILSNDFDVSPQYLVWGGAIRVYRPGDIFKSPPQAHRYLNGASFSGEEEFVRTLREGCYVLSRHDLSSDQRAPITSEVDIERLRQADHLEVLRSRPQEPSGTKSIEELEKQLIEWRAMADSFADDNSKLQSELADSRQTNAKLSRELQSLEWVNEQLREDNTSLRRELANPTLRAESGGDIDPADLVDGENTLRAVKARFGERIETTKKFDRSMVEFEPNQKELFQRVFEAVTDIHEILWREKFQSQGGNFVTEFNSQSRFGLTMTETQLTKQKPGMAELRADSHNGESFEAWSHVKYGNKPGEQFRIHFVFFEESKKIVLSWIGDHMPTSSSTKTGGRRG